MGSTTTHLLPPQPVPLLRQHDMLHAGYNDHHTQPPRIPIYTTDNRTCVPPTHARTRAARALHCLPVLKTSTHKTAQPAPRTQTQAVPTQAPSPGLGAARCSSSSSGNSVPVRGAASWGNI